MTEMNAKTVKNYLQKSIMEVRRLPSSSFEQEIKKAKTIGYLASVAAQVIKENRETDKAAEADAAHREWIAKTQGAYEPDLFDEFEEEGEEE